MEPFAAAIARASAFHTRAGLPAAFIGGLAVIGWGEVRMTKDVDLLVDLRESSVAEVLAVAAECGYQWDDDEAALLEAGGFLRLEPVAGEKIPLDLISADTEFHRSALGRAVTVHFMDLDIELATAEDLILMKLIAFRPQDTLDLDTVFERRAAELDRDYLRGWADKLGVAGKLAMWLEPDA